MTLDNLLTIKETMAHLKLSRATIYRLIDQGKLKPVKVGGSVRFREDEVNAFGSHAPVVDADSIAPQA